MNAESELLPGIVLLALLAYALRALGFVLARWIQPESLAGRLLRQAPGNLFVAFLVMGVAAGGWPTAAGIAVALTVAVTIRQEAAILAAGVAAVTAAAWLLR